MCEVSNALRTRQRNRQIFKRDKLLKTDIPSNADSLGINSSRRLAF